MNFFFLDASALSKRYSLESGAALIDHLFLRTPTNRLLCLMLGAAETASVLVRRKNGGRLTRITFQQALINLTAEVINNPSFRTLPSTNATITTSIPLIVKHSINSTDAVVLRMGLDLAPGLRANNDDLVLVASDQRLLRAAQSEGLTTFNPETQSQADLDALIGP